MTLNLTLTDVFAAGDLDGTLEKIFAASGFLGHFRFGWETGDRLKLPVARDTDHGLEEWSASVRVEN